ncbi:MAG TPA: hypothetical protein VGB85_11970 [Nannocystis sp.]|jgi:hypothetical protein
MLQRSQVLARLTWVVLALVLIGVLGGLHPSDRTRDLVVAAAAILVALLNAPELIDGLRTRGTTVVLRAASRLVAAACVLLFVRSISHEQRWDAKDAYRRCAGPDARWPDDPAQRCRVLHMCINEAAPTPGEHVRLRDLIAATPGCPPP